MSNVYVRPCEVRVHPIMTKKYIIATPAIDDFYKQISRCVRYRIPGAITWGDPRFGKTSAIRFCKDAICADYAKVPAFSFLCHKKIKPSESAFFSNLLESVGHKHPHAGRIDEKRSRLKNFLVEKALASGHGMVIFFADEAQRLSTTEYEWLRDVHDALDDRGVRLITFLVGQRELLNQKNALKEAKQDQIVGRFMIDELPFKGVVSARDVVTCLKSYDDSSFPADSDWNFTRFFFPYAYQNGLRLAKCASMVWEAFRDATIEAKMTKNIEIPMAYFARTIEIALMDNTEMDKPDFMFSPQLWRNAVDNSSYIQAQENLNYLALLDND